MHTEHCYSVDRSRGIGPACIMAFRHPLYKTQWCEFFWRSHGCRWGEQCWHCHRDADFVRRQPLDWKVFDVRQGSDCADADAGARRSQSGWWDGVEQDHAGADWLRWWDDRQGLWDDFMGAQGAHAGGSAPADDSAAWQKRRTGTPAAIAVQTNGHPDFQTGSLCCKKQGFRQRLMMGRRKKFDSFIAGFRRPGARSRDPPPADPHVADPPLAVPAGRPDRPPPLPDPPLADRPKPVPALQSSLADSPPNDSTPAPPPAIRLSTKNDEPPPPPSSPPPMDDPSYAMDLVQRPELYFPMHSSAKSNSERDPAPMEHPTPPSAGSPEFSEWWDKFH